jgi:sugar phosphate isomerase/epimerase
MKRKYSCPDFSFPMVRHDQALNIIQTLEFEGVDVGLMQDRTHLQPADQLKRPEESGRTLAERLEAHNLRCADLFLQAGTDFAQAAINQPDSEKRAALRTLFERALDYAGALGAEHMTILPGAAFGSDGSDWVRCAEELAWRVEKARMRSIALGVEAHLGSIIATPERALALLNQVAGLTLTLDFSHFIRQGIALERALALIPYASHFHARGANPGKLQCAVEENAIDFARALRGLDQAGYTGYICTEYTYEAWEQCNRTDGISEMMQLRAALNAIS